MLVGDPTLVHSLFLSPFTLHRELVKYAPSCPDPGERLLWVAKSALVGRSLQHAHGLVDPCVNTHTSTSMRAALCFYCSQGVLFTWLAKRCARAPNGNIHHHNHHCHHWSALTTSKALLPTGGIAFCVATCLWGRCLLIGAWLVLLLLLLFLLLLLQLLQHAWYSFLNCQLLLAKMSLFATKAARSVSISGYQLALP